MKRSIPINNKLYKIIIYYQKTDYLNSKNDKNDLKNTQEIMTDLSDVLHSNSIHDIGRVSSMEFFKWLV